MAARRLILRSHQCPGDILMLTAAVRDLHAAAPGQFQTDVRTSASDLWLHNPHITPLLDHEPDIESLEMHYPLVHESNNRALHFIHGYAQYLEQQLGLQIPVTQFRGDIHLSDEEKAGLPGHLGPLPERFWLLMAGGKFDFTAKWWNPASYQAVVDHFRGRIEFLQCGEANHWHPPLRGVTNLIGRTSIRDFVRLMYYAEGVICPVTFAMHLAAATPRRTNGPPNRACIVISGGREPPHWEAYPQHQFLHTLGQLDCCANGGCWKSRCQPVGDGDEKDRRNLCERPVAVRDDLRIPQCMELIRPSDVIAAVERTLEGWQMSRGKSPAAVATPKVPTSQGNVTPQGHPAPAAERKRVLIEFRHGLGDAVQLTAVLRHLQRYHPDWDIDVAALRGKHSAFHRLCRRTIVLDDLRREYGDYADTFRLDWDENRSADARWPSTKVTRCLLDVFRLTPQPDLCRYSIEVSPTTRRRAEGYLESLCGPPDEQGRYRAVLLHYEGNTSTDKKNLTHAVAKSVCDTVLRLGLVPIILDWDLRSPLPDQQTIFCPGAGHPLWGHGRSGDAEQLAALIDAARLMIGIDSGPLHVAGATSTRTLGVWTRHHPVHFFDRANQVLHLVPENHEELVNGPPALKYFRQAYQHRIYRQLAADLSAAVEELLGVPTKQRESAPTPTNPLKSTAFNEVYYDEHRAAGLDYLSYGDWQRDYGRWLVESFNWQNQRVLDVGCACGSIARGFQEAGADIAGCDVNESMIVRGRNEWPELASRLAICDAGNLHLWSDGHFDAIHTAQVAEHWPVDLVPRILKELARVTRPDGLLFCCLDTAELFERQGRDGAQEDPTHVCIRPLAWWHDRLAEAGWDIVTEELGPALRSHPQNYLKKYDWDYIVARRRPVLPSAVESERDPRRVSIVIAARNNGQFLREAIVSALVQSHPCQVVYADDGSTDDSLAIARDFVARGLTVLESPGHFGVCAARNRGAAVAQGDCLVFLDGDDRLPVDFVAQHLKALVPGAPFAYGPALAFGDGPHVGLLWGVPAWKDYDRWQTNTVNTCAIYTRWAFEAAGRWRGSVPTMWDWDLALRASRFGTPCPSTATMEYRQHRRSWSVSTGEKLHAERATFLGEIRRANARLSIGTILSGRVPELFDCWMESLIYAVRGLALSERPELVLLDHGRNDAFSEVVRRGVSPYGDTFSSIRIIPHRDTYQFDDEKSRRDAVAAFMASSSVKLQQHLTGDITWLVEDDILLPLTAGRDLWRAVTEGWQPPAAVAGCYRNRHVPEQFVGGWWKPEGPVELETLPTDDRPFDVDFTGTGCLMYWTHHSPTVWESHCKGVPAHDWAWCEAVRQKGKRVLMHPGVRCGHARSVDDVLYA